MFVSTFRIRALWSWLMEARFVWLTLGVIAVALTVALRTHTPEPVIRLTGLILQLLGLCTIIWGIYETRALFCHPSFASKAKLWFGRFPLLKKNIVLSATGCSMGVAMGKIRGHITHGPGQTLETRIVMPSKRM